MHFKKLFLNWFIFTEDKPVCKSIFHYRSKKLYSVECSTAPKNKVYPECCVTKGLHETSCSCDTDLCTSNSEKHTQTLCDSGTNDIYDLWFLIWKLIFNSQGLRCYNCHSKSCGDLSVAPVQNCGGPLFDNGINLYFF